MSFLLLAVLLQPSGCGCWLRDRALVLALIPLAGAVTAMFAWRRRKVRERAVTRHYAYLNRYAHDAVVLLDDEFRIVHANDRAAAWYGYTVTEMLGMHARLLRAPEAITPDEMLDGLARDGGVVFETVHRRKDGSLFPVELSVRKLRAGGHTWYQTIARDITERKRAGEELARALASAREATELKSQFLANMSHEIRTPIHGVLGMTELLLCTRLDAEQREYADAVRRSAHGLLAVINDILDLSKIEAGKLELERILFDLWSVVEEVVALVAFRAYSKDLELTCLIQPDVPRLVRGDPARLRQVLTNLAGNAVKFTDRGEVAIRVETAGEEGCKAVVRFSVADSGIGIAPGQKERLFKSFVQGDPSTTRRYGGTGLGLAISRHLVERMGGRIDFDSEPGRGSTFWFTTVLEKDAAGTSQPGLCGTFGGVRALVVDDKPANRMIVRRYLDSWGCRTDEAGGGEAGLSALLDAAAAGDPFRVALVDIRSQERDSGWLAAAVRAEPCIAATSLVAMATVGLPGQVAGLRQSGFQAVLSKPVRPSQLYGRLLEALEPAAEPAEPPPAKAIAVRHPGRRVLVAEDNDINQKIVLRLLEKSACEAHRVADGRQAVEALEAADYDLVLMDVQMPEMDGFAATAEIRRREAARGRRTPIAAMTANAMTGDRERCLAAGMDDYISKPVRLEDLQRMLNRWLG